MNARLKAAGWSYLKYLMFLGWSVACVVTGIAIMWVTAVGVCTAAFR